MAPPDTLDPREAEMAPRTVARLGDTWQLGLLPTGLQRYFDVEPDTVTARYANVHDIRPEGAAHVDALVRQARGDGVRVDYTSDPQMWQTRLLPNLNGSARPVEVFIPPPVSDFAYATALHEFGHYYTPHAGTVQPYDEPRAAVWARRHARYWTPPMRESTLIGLASYAHPGAVYRPYGLEWFLRYVQWLDTQGDRPGDLADA